MRYVEDLLLQVKLLDDGAIFTRRKDRKPVTPADLERARQLADSEPGVTVADVLRIWPGSKVAQK